MVKEDFYSYNDIHNPASWDFYQRKGAIRNTASFLT